MLYRRQMTSHFQSLVYDLVIYPSHFKSQNSAPHLTLYRLVNCYSESIACIDIDRSNELKEHRIEAVCLIVTR